MVNAQLSRLKDFIEKEAQEKAKEIRVKADEEYEIEKSSIVGAETAAIDAAHEQKMKKAALAQQITKSIIGNKTRLRILAEKEKVLEDVFSEAADSLKKLSSLKSDYAPVLEKLIEEGLYSLMEDKVTLLVRDSDADIAKAAAEKAAEKFAKKAKFSVKVSIAEEYLDANSAGGVILRNKTGKIEVDNTLDARLKLLSEKALPGVRLEIFGPSESRKFFD